MRNPIWSVEKVILDLVESSANHVTPSDLDRQVSMATGHDRRTIRNAVKSLVQKGFLEYRDKNGRTGISRSFSRPVRLSDHTIVSPPDLGVDKNPGDVVIRLNSGTAFGRGDHPTTRLCVMALDHLLTGDFKEKSFYQSALDIGTGSGILAIVTARLGVANVWACDRDTVAEAEAHGNIALNDLSDRIFMVKEFDTHRTYDVIIANLRYPTLIDLCPVLEKISSDESALVLSGFKPSELETVHAVYAYSGCFDRFWLESCQGWTGLVYKKIKK